MDQPSAGPKDLGDAQLEPANINLLEACVIGLVAAIGAVAVKEGVGLLGTLRLHLNGVYPGPYLFPLFGLIGGAVAGALVQFVAPEAAGSGIPQTKACIMGEPIPLNFKTCLAKLFGGIIALGSGLSMGREGPTVHLSAALSAQATTYIHTSPKHRAQLIAAGAGAGLAAAFNAPLAGVMFVLEELLGRMSSFTVGTCVVACFVAAVFARLVGVHSLDIQMHPSQSLFFARDIPFYLLLGVIAGLVGALFNSSIIGGLTVNRKLKIPVTLSCAMAGLITGVTMLYLPPLFHNFAGLREALLAQHLDLNTVLLSFATLFGLTVLAYSSGAPGGLFAPSLTLGACLGQLISLLQLHLTGATNLETFAIVGMGAVFCAVARVPMTSVIIIFEMTTDFNVVLPLMISCVVAYLVAHRLNPGSIYDQLLQFQGINIEASDDTSIANNIAVARAMQTDVQVVRQSDSVKSVKALFNGTSHKGFPVVDQDNHAIGIFTSEDLVRICKRKIDENTPISQLMTPRPVTIAHDATLARALTMLSKYKINRLPVTRENKLVGIITRGDITRTESLALTSLNERLLHKGTGSTYLMYQSRSPEMSNGKILIVAEDIESAGHLLRLAAHLARPRGYAIECLHVITVPPDKDPSTTKVSSAYGKRIVECAEQVGEELSVPVHTNIRVANAMIDALIETIEAHAVDMALLEWKGETRSLGGERALLKLQNQCHCPVVLAKLNSPDFTGKRLMVPFSSDPESKLADELAKSITLTYNDAKYLPVPESLSLDRGAPAKTIYAAAQLAQCDVLLLGLKRDQLTRILSRNDFGKAIASVKESSVLIAVNQS
ncbi:MAG: chloride channel protein [Candidatus Obscuribacter sp.]|nr:chloride channel protein [Candidatus Obscuribacter sp.]